MNNLKIGTASWTDKSLIDSGAYYPEDCTSAEARLRFYSGKFPLVEEVRTLPQRNLAAEALQRLLSDQIRSG